MQELKEKSLIILDCDLRINDNPALFNGIKNHQEAIILFILDEKNKREIGSASKWFLHHSLLKIQKELKNHSLDLWFAKGDSLTIINGITDKYQVSNIYFNQHLEPYNLKLGEKLINFAKENNIKIYNFHHQTIFEKDLIKNKSGEYFKVFTPFWKNCLENIDKINTLTPCISKIEHKAKNAIFKNTTPEIIDKNIDYLDLLPKKEWANNFVDYWKFSSEEINTDFDKFLKEKSFSYDQNRNLPFIDGTSKLSPHLHFGTISPLEIFIKAIKYKKEKNSLDNKGIDCFISEIGWREFSYYLLQNFPDLHQKPFKDNFNNFPWLENQEQKNILLKKWQKGQTGFPIIDAGMMELWKTGWMHNRVRMIVASFLIKDLLINWLDGEKWFWDCLVDADLASNSASWQWVAGCGADAAPYFRIFNPTLQGEKFDPNGDYVKKWLPQLKSLPNHLIHKPWSATKIELALYNLTLGKDYPLPIVDHDKARKIALEAIKKLTISTKQITDIVK